MFVKFSLVVGLMLLGLQAAQAQGGFVLEFGSAGNPGQTSFSATQGNSVVLELYITQTGSEERLNSASTGLTLAEFDFKVSNGTDLSTTGFTRGPGFVENPFPSAGPTLGPSAVRSDGAFFTLSAEDTDGTTGVTATSNSILLGTATFDVSALAVGPYTLSLTPSDNTFSQFELASPGFPTPITVTPGEAALNITAVPEPSSLLILAGSSLLLLRRRRR